MRGNRSELAPGRKSPRCHVNTPSISTPDSLARKYEKKVHNFVIFCKTLRYRILLSPKAMGYKRIIEGYENIEKTDLDGSLTHRFSFNAICIKKMFYNALEFLFFVWLRFCLLGFFWAPSKG